MQQFNINDYTGEVCMHCSTEEEANAFLTFLDSIGRTWCNGRDYLENTRFDDYGEDTCYFFNEGTYDSVQYAEECNWTVLECCDFDFNFLCVGEEFETDERPLDDFFSAFSTAANPEVCI